MQYTSNIDQHITHISTFINNKAQMNVIVLHGMAEHRFRYDNFAKQLSENQINVFTLDLRGHGESKVGGHLGYFGSKDGYLNNIHDIQGSIANIKEAYPLPTVLLGHSMGSLFARSILYYYPNLLDAYILIGTPYLPQGFSILRPILKIAASFLNTKEAKPLSKIMNQTFNKEIDHPKTDLDWLSINEENIQNYIDDPLCNFPFTYQGYVDLFDLMNVVYKKEWPKQNSNLPIMFLSGAQDPCADFNRDGFNKAIQKLKDVGYKNITFKLYEHSRHEILNDNEKDAVINDILTFLLKLREGL